MEKRELSTAEWLDKCETYCAKSEHCVADVRRKLYEWQAPAEIAEFIEQNLYANDFQKTNHLSYVSSTHYAKRYISTGIDHLLSGYYPENTMLLGYVLVGTVHDAVYKVNQNLVNDSRGTESIKLQVYEEFPALVLGVSAHPNGMGLDHCFLQF